MTAERRILAIPGSLRRGSLNLALLNASRDLTPPTMAIDVCRDLADVPLFDADLESVDGSGDPAGVRAIRRAVDAADGVLISSPEYNRAPPGVVKNLIDWLSRRDAGSLRGKPVAVIGATPGAWGTRISQALLGQMLLLAGAHVFADHAFYLPRAHEALQDGRLVDDDARSDIQQYLAGFDDWVATLGRVSIGS
ncbi:NADPH-dependent FMN reductase [soil metagenome]